MYNLASGVETSIEEAAKTVNRLTQNGACHLSGGAIVGSLWLLIRRHGEGPVGFGLSGSRGAN